MLETRGLELDFCCILVELAIVIVIVNQLLCSTKASILLSLVMQEPPNFPYAPGGFGWFSFSGVKCRHQSGLQPTELLPSCRIKDQYHLLHMKTSFQEFL